MADSLKQRGLSSYVKAEAAKLGFDSCRITDARLDSRYGERLEAMVANGHHGSMDWMAKSILRRKSPEKMWREARTAIMLAMNYSPSSDPMENLERPDNATISVYARNRDYHDVIKGRLKILAGKLASKSGFQVKVFVDTAPLMEKPLAEKAGVGWQGKHTNLVSRHFGSWLFLGSILTDGALGADIREKDYCGSCRACLDICPTDAFPAPYQLDARKCISYLTIEHHGPIERSLRTMMGNRIFGCDDCLAVCPWNKFARQARETKLVGRAELASPKLAEFLTLDDAQFRRKFSGSPIKRIGRNRFMRNVLIAAGNSCKPDIVDLIRPHLNDPDPVVRGAAIWALGRILQKEDFLEEMDRHLPDEGDEGVVLEWREALDKGWRH